MTGTVTSPTIGVGLLGRIVDHTTDLRLVGLMRSVFGVIVIRHFWSDLTADRVPVEHFHVPWWSWLPVPGAGQYRVLLWVAVAAAVLMIIGVAARVATSVAFAVVLYLLVVDAAGFAHNRAFLTWMLFGLTLLPTDRSWSVKSWLARRRGTPLDTKGFSWPVAMLRVIASGVYLASGGTKLLDSAWRSGLVLWDRTMRFQDTIPSAFDGFIHDALVSRWFHRVLSPAAIATELFIAIGLWFPRTRRWALAVAIAFHGSIEITAKVQTFSYSALIALLIWLIPITPSPAGDDEIPPKPMAPRAGPGATPAQ